MICSCFPFARKIPVRKRREQRAMIRYNKLRKSESKKERHSLQTLVE